VTETIHIRAIDPQIPPHDPAVYGIFKTREFRYGTIKYLASDFGVGAMLTKYGEYSEGEVVLFRKLLKFGDIVVSAGGNIGVHLIPLSKIVGYSGGTIITFEPQKFIREKLLMPNLEMNGCENVIVFDNALGSDFGTSTFPEIDYSAPNNFGGMELREGGKVTIDVMPLDSFEYQRLDMLMLDVEGFELPALKGAKETILRCRPYLYVEIDRDNTREHVLAYMKETLKYELLFHTPLAFNADNFDKNPDNPYGQMVSIMALGIPV
jgi:FkbM family methyltransferase